MKDRGFGGFEPALRLPVQTEVGWSSHLSFPATSAAPADMYTRGGGKDGAVPVASPATPPVLSVSPTPTMVPADPYRDAVAAAATITPAAAAASVTPLTASVAAATDQPLRRTFRAFCAAQLPFSACATFPPLLCPPTAASPSVGANVEVRAAKGRRSRRGSVSRRRSTSRGRLKVRREHDGDESRQNEAHTEPPCSTAATAASVEEEASAHSVHRPVSNLCDMAVFEGLTGAPRGLAVRTATAAAAVAAPHCPVEIYHHDPSTGSGGGGVEGPAQHFLRLPTPEVQQLPRQIPTVRPASCVIVKATRRPPSLSHGAYRLLRLCFLRRWSWQLWTANMGRRSGEAAEEGVEDEGFEEEEEDDGEERTERHARNSSGVSGGVSVHVHEPAVDHDDAEGSSWAAWRTVPLADTRRRGRGPAVSPSTVLDGRTRRRGRQATAYHQSRSGGDGRASTAGAVLRLFFTFLCYCCCCPGGPCDRKARWAARAGRSLRNHAARHRGILFCFCALLALVNYFVTLPLLTASLVALLENENLFVARMRVFRFPHEVGAVTAPLAVAVRVLRDPPLAAVGGGSRVGHTVRSALCSGRAAPRRPHFAPPRLPVSLFTLFGRRTLALAQLPSWTLFPLSPDCVECLQDGAYAAAVAAHPTAPHSAMQQGVYATSTSPLGRIGPMLLAMASVTDDVAVREELMKWPWVPRMAQQAELLRRSQAGAPPAHLAVLGIPSMDTQMRAALRLAQRQTWMTYFDVARTENDFTGRLLVLYVLAASERTRARTSWAAEEAGSPPADFLSMDAQRLRADPSLLLPTANEYAAAEEYYYTVTAEAVEEANAKDADVSYVRRRMRLLRGWRREASTGSPCESITDVVWTAHEGAVSREGVRVNVSSTLLADLAEALELPVAPLFSTPAALICHASTALWQEALAHRNVLWVDMLTDRRPTSGKKIGQGGNWGLPVEVGMSQKLVLWLEYAYHAFPDVPFIVKGDDDTYVKVPQYLSDIHYMQRGRSGRALDELTTANSARGLQWVRRAFSSAAPTGEDYLRTKATEECMYWGSMRRWNGEVYFGAGMMFLLHRRLVQTVLEERPEYNNDVVRLAVQDYQPRYAHSYFAAMMDHEDVMVGKLLAERRVRALQLCPYHRAWYVWETWERFHDVHHGRLRNVTWSTTVAHRCTTTDLAFLHFYFQNEYRYGGAETGAKGKEADEVSQQAAQAWLAQLWAKRPGGDLAAGAETTNKNGKTKASTAAAAVADVLWSVPVAMNHTPLPYVRSAGDKVAVYEVEYSPFGDGYLVLDGWIANTRRRSSRKK